VNPVALVSFPGFESDRLEPVRGETISAFLRRSQWGEYIKGVGWSFKLPTICVVNGKPLFRRNWSRHRIRKNDKVMFVTRPLGGGGGGGGGGNSTAKSVMGIVAMVAVMAFAWWAAPIIGGALMLGTFGTGLVMGGIMFGGAMLVNSLFAPKAGGQATPQAAEASESLGTLSVSGNQIKPLDTRPSWYGKRKRFPNFAATPWSEYEGDNQYLNVLLSLGEGDHTVHKIFNDDTEIWDETEGFSDSFTDVEMEMYDQNEAITLFAPNVVSAPEVSGNEVSETYAGPFVVNTSGTQVDKIALDFIMPRGLFRIIEDSNQVGDVQVYVTAQARLIDDAGAPLGAYFNLFFEHEFNANTQQPIRFTVKSDVTPGRYEVRVRRTTPTETGPTNFDETLWAGLRGFLVGDNTLPVKTIAIRMKSNGQLTDYSARRFAVLSTRKLPVWDAIEGEFIIQDTRNPFYAALDILSNEDYGAGRPLDKIDLTTLIAMADEAEERGDTFDFDFTNAVPVTDAIDMACGVCRARHFWAGDVTSFVRDENTAPEILLTDMEVVRSSTNFNFILNDEESADCVILEYEDSVTHRPAQVQYPPSEASFFGVKPSRIQIEGITEREHAFREAQFWYQQHLYRRTNITVSTEYDGRRLTYGSRIRFQSRLPLGYGQSGLVLERDGLNLIGDRELDWESGEQHFVRLRKANGKLWGPVLVTEGAEPNIMVMDFGDLNDVEYEQGEIEYALDRVDGGQPATFDFGYGQDQSVTAIVLNGRATGDHHMQLSLVVDNDLVHGTSIGDTPPPVDPDFPIDTIPTVVGLTVNFRQGQREPIIDASWWPTPNASMYVADISYDGGLNWQRVYQGSAPNFTAVVDYADIVVRVAAISSVHGPFSVAFADVPDIVPTDVIVGPTELTSAFYDMLVTRYGEQLKELQDFKQQISLDLANQDAFNAIDKIHRRDELKVTKDGLTASIEEVETVAISATEAVAQLSLDVTAALEGQAAEIAGIEASVSSISQDFTAFAGPDGTFAQFQTGVTSRFEGLDDGLSEIVQDFNTFAGPNGTFATYQTTVESRFGTVEATVNSISEEFTTFTGQDGGFAAYKLYVESRFLSNDAANEQYAKVTVIADTYASKAELGGVTSYLSARYAVQLDVNGYASGFNLFSGETFSHFTVLVDAFRVAKAGVVGGDALTVFEINTSGGTAAITMKGTFIADGAIIARTIAVDAIAARNIQAESIQAIHLTAEAITAINAQFDTALITNLTAENIRSDFAMYNQLAKNPTTFQIGFADYGGAFVEAYRTEYTAGQTGIVKIDGFLLFGAAVGNAVSSSVEVLLSVYDDTNTVVLESQWTESYGGVDTDSSGTTLAGSLQCPVTQGETYTIRYSFQFGGNVTGLFEVAVLTALIQEPQNVVNFELAP
jgi:hypothetical protein